MTERQRQCLDYIRRHIEETGIAPSYPEIARELGIKSRSAVFETVQALVRDGCVEKTGSGSRNLRLPGVDLSAVPVEVLRAELERRG